MNNVEIVQTAERICRNPRHEAVKLSTAAAIAMAARLLALEDAAASTFEMLLKTDELGDLRRALGPEAAERRHALAQQVVDTTATLSGALAALGYSQEKQDAENIEDQDGRVAPALAAE